LAVLKIRTFGDPVLRSPAGDIEELTEAHKQLIKDMFDTMRDAPGVGLAGPQVGVMERIFVYEASEEDSGVLINPKIVERSEEIQTDDEGCLSLPGLYYPVERSYSIVVEGRDGEGNPVTIEAEDYKARIFQHEIDHLDGVLFIDHLSQEDRREALAALREQALGFPPAPTQGHGEETF
jgi:peptide deformylase